MITLKDIKRIYPNALEYEQVGAKQLFIVSYKHYDILVSYRTIIGIAIHDKGNAGVWNITTEKHSVTTSKQCTQFRRMYSSESVEPEELERLVKSVR